MKTLRNPSDRQEILTRLAQLSPADRGEWGSMSVHQVICHLTDSYRIALGQKTAAPATGFMQHTLMKWIALRAPFKWTKGFPTLPELEQGRGGSEPIGFEADRNILFAVLSEFCEDLPQPCLPHPVMGTMTAEDWWRWGYLHADHHLRQFGRK